VDIRAATENDAAELVRLRQQLFDSLGVPRLDDWQAPCEAQLRRSLTDGTMAAFVADRPDGQGAGLVACGIAMVAQRLGSPGNPRGRHGHIQSMVTEADFRGRGLARAIFHALMQWLREEQRVTVVDLHATDMGAPLYREYGFHDAEQPAMVWRAAIR
jgi:GNAT superfamily N-acetyltransferase